MRVHAASESEKPFVPPEKLSGYLLSETHALGREKARFFRAHGYSNDRVNALEQGLLAIAMGGEVLQEVASAHGTKYVVDGGMMAPQGTILNLRTVWIVEPRDDRPRFVTAYPAKEVKK
ncbi:MAG: DUF6883 domain-containing protein [Thermoanaerobaculia bacterium]